MDCVSSMSKMAFEWDAVSEVSTYTGCDVSRCSSGFVSSAESTPLCRVDSSEATEIGASIYFLPNSVAPGIIMRNTFVDYIDEQELARSARRRTRSAPPALAAERHQLRESFGEYAAEESTASGTDGLAASSLLDAEWPCLDGLNMPMPALAALRFLRLANGVSTFGEPPAEVPQEDIVTTPADTADLPSLGSHLHSTGGCRPCGFFWKGRGCSNGAECEFCHLCDGDERKRRHRNRKTMFKAQALTQLIPRAALNDDGEDEDVL
eukprot:TRINITY_DN869_c0_g2_i1.p1 TRINITY_DN869_c0_g2~~TRINITY_DN869_c0_g2_i1.p1  ORF type:complete len:265 (-),score=46.91 TRINITY_DN869_c0_g2_i1:637-1431(-)